MLPNPLFWNVHMYGIMIAVGILCCFFVLFFYNKKLGIEPRFTDFIYYNAIASILLGFGAASLFQAFYNYLDNPEGGFNIGSGMTFIGGLIGGTVTFLIIYFIFHKKYDTVLWDVLTIIPCPILIAHAWGRIGCFFAGCCYGKVSYEHGLKFPNIAEPVLPTQLYEAIFLFVLFAVCTFLLFRFRFNYNMSLYLVAYGIFRFVIEYFRGDERGSFVSGISPSQFWSIVMVALGIALFVYMYLRDKKKQTPPPAVA